MTRCAKVDRYDLQPSGVLAITCQWGGLVWIINVLFD